MGRKRVGLVLLLLTLVSVVALHALTRPRMPDTLVTIRFVKTGAFEFKGYRNYGTTFWITNHTDKTLVAMLERLEVLQAGPRTNGATEVNGFFTFNWEHGRDICSQLPPHESAYATFESLELPPAGRWRLRVAVGIQLQGFDAFLANLRSLPAGLKMRMGPGGSFKNTGISINPLRGAYKYKVIHIDVDGFTGTD